MEDSVERRVKGKVTHFVTKAFKILFFVIAGIAFVLLFGYAFMWLWNWLMPELFGLSALSYWQAVGLLVLAKIIFGGLGNGPSGKNKNKSPRGFQNKFRSRCNSNFSKWEHYDTFWQEEGQQAYTDYVARKMEKQNPIDGN